MHLLLVVGDRAERAFSGARPPDKPKHAGSSQFMHRRRMNLSSCSEVTDRELMCRLNLLRGDFSS